MKTVQEYLDVGGRDGKTLELLASLADSPDARYVLTFDLFKAYARMLVETKLQTLDLADLYGNPWWDYEVARGDRLLAALGFPSRLESPDR